MSQLICITVNVKGEEISMSLQEAKQLYNELSELFGTKDFQPIQSPWWTQPVTFTNPEIPPWTITCDNVEFNQIKDVIGQTYKDLEGRN